MSVGFRCFLTRFLESLGNRSPCWGGFHHAFQFLCCSRPADRTSAVENDLICVISASEVQLLRTGTLLARHDSLTCAFHRDHSNGCSYAGRHVTL